MAVYIRKLLMILLLELGEADLERRVPPPRHLRFECVPFQWTKKTKQGPLLGQVKIILCRSNIFVYVGKNEGD
jgi:hypothetical protein